MPTFEQTARMSAPPRKAVIKLARTLRAIAGVRFGEAARQRRHPLS